MMKKALLAGASGFVGECLLNELLNSPDYDKVTVIVRKGLGISHPKLTTILTDYDSLPAVKDQIEVDHVFITLGTTKKRTPNRVDYYRVDHDYPVLITQIAKERGAKSVFLLTAIGGDAESRIFYTRTKGEVERDVIAKDLEHTHIFRPSLILGDRKEFRLLEKIAITTWPFFDTILRFSGPSRYRGIRREDIARAMARAGRQEDKKVAGYEWKEMMALAKDR